MNDLTGCPQCGAPAEVIDSYVAASTSGPLPMVRTRCVQRHYIDQAREG